jgi:precorrin-6A synthase
MSSWRALVIGIGSGVPGQLTADATAAMRAVDVFLVADKRAETSDLVTMRTELCAAVIDHDRYRVVALPDPARQTGAYLEDVAVWHRRRAAGQAAAVRAELPDGGTVGFLVWGDPSLYDSTLRQLELIRGTGLDLDVRVVPGLSSPTLLAAAHRIVLNQVGRPVHVTTGRRLVEEYDPAHGDVVVMLDGGLVCAELAEDHPELVIYWGAQLGLADETLVAGPLVEVIDRIRSERRRLRARRGWVMDTYLLRRP